MAREQAAPANEVQITGRVSGTPEERELTSGDRLVQLRVVVPRPRTRSRGGAGTGRAGVGRQGADGARAAPRTQVDTIDVACWTARARTAALRLEDGSGVRVQGALRRRFFRTGAGAASRYEVEARSLTAVDLQG